MDTATLMKALKTTDRTLRNHRDLLEELYGQPVTAKNGRSVKWLYPGLVKASIEGDYLPDSWEEAIALPFEYTPVNETALALVPTPDEAPEVIVVDLVDGFEPVQALARYQGKEYATDGIDTYLNQVQAQRLALSEDFDQSQDDNLEAFKIALKARNAKYARAALQADAELANILGQAGLGKL